MSKELMLSTIQEYKDTERTYYNACDFMADFFHSYRNTGKEQRHAIDSIKWVADEIIGNNKREEAIENEKPDLPTKDFCKFQWAFTLNEFYGYYEDAGKSESSADSFIDNVCEYSNGTQLGVLILSIEKRLDVDVEESLW